MRTLLLMLLGLTFIPSAKASLSCEELFFLSDDDAALSSDFAELRKIVLMMGFTSRRDYRNWESRPQIFPAKPDVVFKNHGWKGWGHFLGYSMRAPILPYEQAREIVSQMNFTTREEYRNWQNRPQGVPVDPETTYRNKGWQGWEHFLGYSHLERYQIKAYEEVQSVVSQKGFASPKDYMAWKERPNGFPYNPASVYLGFGWQGWRHFLGHPERVKMKSYSQAQQFVSKWGFKTRAEYRMWGKRPEDIPYKPDEVYSGKGWQGWEHFLTPQKLKSLIEAREVVRQQSFSRIKEFNQWRIKNKPEGIPADPSSTYAKSGWISWEDFLGQSKWYSYEEAKVVVAQAGITNTIDYKNWIGRPLRMPAEPDRIYGSVFSWRDFLSNPDLRESPFTKKIKPYEEAQAIVVAMGFKTAKEYREWKKPEGIPFDPDRIYKDKGWKGWAAYLGIK